VSFGSASLAAHTAYGVTIPVPDPSQHDVFSTRTRRTRHSRIAPVLGRELLAVRSVQCVRREKAVSLRMSELWKMRLCRF